MGVINTNVGALRKSQRAHDNAMKKLADQRAKDRELNSLRTDVAELKKLVYKLLEEKNADTTDSNN